MASARLLCLIRFILIGVVRIIKMSRQHRKLDEVSEWSAHSYTGFVVECVIFSHSLYFSNL